jgi:hypothetical protein
MHSEEISLCSKIPTEHTNALCGRNIGVLCVKHRGTCNNRWAFLGLRKWKIETVKYILK